MGAANKKKKQSIQERQRLAKAKIDPSSSHNRSLLDRIASLQVDLSEQRRELAQLRGVTGPQAKAIEDLERKLKAREALTADMHNNHVVMRQSLHNIRALHQHLGDEICMECGKPWPCETFELIKSPEHLVVTKLIEMQRELSRKEGSEAEAD